MSHGLAVVLIEEVGLIRNNLQLKGIAKIKRTDRRTSMRLVQQMPLTGKGLKDFSASRPRKWINDHQSFNKVRRITCEVFHGQIRIQNLLRSSKDDQGRSVHRLVNH